jgi:uncharacterized DUF497 family protein
LNFCHQSLQFFIQSELELKRVDLQVKGFDWDEGNRVKCQKHGLLIKEIEDFFRQKLYIAPDIKHSQSEQRFLAVGYSSSGKPMFVAFTLRNNLIRPISARYMHEKEAKQYEQTFTQADE